MYKETLEVLMEGINDPIKEQIIKNQLIYHFKNKNPDNMYAIDNSVVIVRRVLEEFNIADIIAVQPIAKLNNECITVTNDDNEEIDTFTTNLAFNEIPQLQPEINQAIANELDHSITSKIIEAIYSYAPYPVNNSEITIDLTKKLFPKNFVDDIVTVTDEVSAEWMVVGLAELTIFRSHDDFISNNCDVTRLSGGLEFVGTIYSIKVYTALSIIDTILIGSNDDENPPIIYAPETMLIVGKSVDNTNGDIRNELLSSSEIFTDLVAISERYRKVSTNIEINVDLLEKAKYSF